MLETLPPAAPHGRAGGAPRPAAPRPAGPRARGPRGDVSSPTACPRGRAQRPARRPRPAAHDVPRQLGALLRARGRDRRPPGLGLPALRPDLAQRRRSWPSACARSAGSPPARGRAAAAGPHLGQRARCRRCPARRPGAPPRTLRGRAAGGRIDRDALARLPRAQRLPPHRRGRGGRRLRGPRRPARHLPERLRRSRCGSTSSAPRSSRSAPSTRSPSARWARSTGWSCGRSARCMLDDGGDRALPSRLSAAVRRRHRRPAARGGRGRPQPSPAWSTGCRCSTTSLVPLTAYLDAERRDRPSTIWPTTRSRPGRALIGEHYAGAPAAAAGRRELRRRPLPGRCRPSSSISTRAGFARALATPARPGSSRPSARRRGRPPGIAAGPRPRRPPGARLRAERADRARQPVRRDRRRTCASSWPPASGRCSPPTARARLERLKQVLADHGFDRLTTRRRAGRTSPGSRCAAIAVLPLERGFVAPGAARPGRARPAGRPPEQRPPPARRTRRATSSSRTSAPSARATSSSTPSTASAGSRAWRRSRSAARRTTACKLVYHGGDKLFVPVENLDVLSRYGHADQEVAARQAGRRRLADAARPRSSSGSASWPAS